MQRYGTTREQLGWIPVTQRENASRNPAAVYRDALSIDDYLNARMITTPFGLYDCDVPCDGAVAVVVSAAEPALSNYVASNVDDPHVRKLLSHIGLALAAA